MVVEKNKSGSLPLVLLFFATTLLVTYIGTHYFLLLQYLLFLLYPLCCTSLYTLFYSILTWCVISPQLYITDTLHYIGVKLQVKDKTWWPIDYSSTF